MKGKIMERRTGKGQWTIWDSKTIDCATVEPYYDYDPINCKDRTRYLVNFNGQIVGSFYDTVSEARKVARRKVRQCQKIRKGANK